MLSQGLNWLITLPPGHQVILQVGQDFLRITVRPCRVKFVIHMVADPKSPWLLSTTSGLESAGGCPAPRLRPALLFGCLTPFTSVLWGIYFS